MSNRRVRFTDSDDEEHHEDINDFKKYKKEIPELKRIKTNLKRRAHDIKHNLINIKSGIMGSDGLAVRESLIEDVNSLKQKVAQLEKEMSELMNRE